MLQISIIVLTYNPNNEKLKQTLAAAIKQKNVCFEIIISDDGSANKDYSFLPEFMKDNGFLQYTLLEHPENRGTVQSCLDAVETARGEFVFLTSPGDFLYDETALLDLYEFAKKNAAPLCFGNAVYYRADESGVIP